MPQRHRAEPKASPTAKAQRGVAHALVHDVRVEVLERGRIR